jgi:ribosomal protein S18 acetylase RimI-like enzyme
MDNSSSVRPDWLTQVDIRIVTASDLPGLEWDGEFQHFRRVYADAYQRARLGLSVLWAADLKGTGIIGQAFIQLASDRHDLADGKQRAYLYSFRIRSQYRNYGLGSHMLDVLHRDLQLRGFKIVTLNVAKDNPDAIRLYIRHGYKIVAHEPGVWSYQDHNSKWQTIEEPAWRMEKIISTQP